MDLHKWAQSGRICVSGEYVAETTSAEDHLHNKVTAWPIMQTSVSLFGQNSGLSELTNKLHSGRDGGYAWNSAHGVPLRKVNQIPGTSECPTCTRCCPLWHQPATY